VIPNVLPESTGAARGRGRLGDVAVIIPWTMY
jgi:hypothetical protein